MPKRCEYVSPLWSKGDEGNAPVSETTRCGSVSAFLHVTVSPGRTTTLLGWNPVARIATFTVALGSDSETAGVAPAITNVPTSRRNNFFIVLTPQF
jgi:hypothetical protein